MPQRPARRLRHHGPSALRLNFAVAGIEIASLIHLLYHFACTNSVIVVTCLIPCIDKYLFDGMYLLEEDNSTRISDHHFIVVDVYILVVKFSIEHKIQSIDRYKYLGFMHLKKG